MELYTERHGKRAPLQKTYSISIDMYSVLLDCCNKYKKNLTHMFTLQCHHDFTDSDYVAFDERSFIARIKIRIPSLIIDDYGTICVPTHRDKYDQYTILDLIEFFAQNIRDIVEYWNNDRYKNFKHIDCNNTSNIFEKFQKEINQIFKETGLLYELTDAKIIERIVENSPLTNEIENKFEEVQEVGARDLLKDAIALYKTPNPAARQDSVEKIWDAFERLKTYYTSLDKKASSAKIVNDMAGGNNDYIDLFNDEFRKLTDIGNSYRIRHHETNKIDITDARYYDYLFNRCLSFLALVVDYLE